MDLWLYATGRRKPPGQRRYESHRLLVCYEDSLSTHHTINSTQ